MGAVAIVNVYLLAASRTSAGLTVWKADADKDHGMTYVNYKIVKNSVHFD
jgi:hypothetical protein